MLLVQRIDINFTVNLHLLSCRNSLTVSPAEVVPVPVVSTERGESCDAKRKNCDFPVPGSPTISMCDSDLTCMPT